MLSSTLVAVIRRSDSANVGFQSSVRRVLDGWKGEGQVGLIRGDTELGGETQLSRPVRRGNDTKSCAPTAQLA
jgi:hypothetical protein